MAEAKVTVSLVDLTQGRLKTLASDVKALADLYKTAHPDDRGTQRVLATQSDQLQELQRHFGRANQEAQKLHETVKGIGNTMRGFSGAVAGGAGLGSIGSLLTAGGIAAAITTVGALLGQTLRVGYEYEKATTRTALVLSSGPHIGNLAELQAATRAGLPMNLSRSEMARALATYGMTSGAGIEGTVRAAPAIARYARAYGMDPSEMAQHIGTLTAMTGQDFEPAARGVFGAAEDAGRLGLRPADFVPTVTAILAQLQATNPGRNYAAGDAAALVANISRLGGYYGTPQGVQGFLGASQGFMAGAGHDLNRASILRSAGVSQEDIWLENQSPDNQRKFLQRYVQLQAPWGGLKSPFLVPGLVGMLGADSARQIIPALRQRQRENPGMSDQDVIASLYSTHTHGQTAEPPLVNTRDQDYLKTSLASYEHLFSHFEDKQLDLGTKMIEGLTHDVDAFGKIVDGDFVGGIKDLIGSNKELMVALAATAAAMILGKSIPGVIGGWLGRILGGGTAAKLAAAGVEGAETAAGGGASAAGLGALALPALWAAGAGTVAWGAKALYDTANNTFALHDALPQAQAMVAKSGGAMSHEQAMNLVMAAQKFKVDPRLLYAEWSAEGGNAASSPFGLLAGTKGYSGTGYTGTDNSFGEYAKVDAAYWASDRADMIKAGIPVNLKSLIAYHEKHFTPVGADNDPHGLNVNKIPNMYRAIDALGGAPDLVSVPGGKATSSQGGRSAAASHPTPHAGTPPSAAGKKTVTVNGYKLDMDIKITPKPAPSTQSGIVNR